MCATSLFIAADGKIGIASTTPRDALTIAVGNNVGMEVLSTNSGFLGYGKIGADRWRMQNGFTNVGLFEIGQHLPLRRPQGKGRRPRRPRDPRVGRDGGDLGGDEGGEAGRGGRV